MFTDEWIAGLSTLARPYVRCRFYEVDKHSSGAFIGGRPRKEASVRDPFPNSGNCSRFGDLFVEPLACRTRRALDASYPLSGICFR